ncbi:MAG: heme-binding protein, partial [Akkermansiaceae bacterium]|nr:heme-binding protein [Akkermansiaceae bacterium]
VLVTPPPLAGGETTVEQTEIPIGGAHGLLWFQGSLYVTVNESDEQSGIWRVTDSNNDGKLDKAVEIKAIKGRGEHGPHALVASPDGKWIYTVAGNFTDLPPMDSSLPIRNWAEDQLLPRRPDANGHAADRMAPGGWVARFRPDGKDWQLFAMGFRNTYDIAFNENGDLFGYDSDMEWDLGMPWYRPTRICHIVPGAEFGWRNGSGPFPTYYEDSMYPQLEMGPGSPTGMASGKGAKFPEKFQRAIYALDWTYATIHAIYLTPDGRGYEARQDEFLAGSGLPLTDVSVGSDGALYFLTGGRRTNSALWRITYTGTESTAPVAYKTKTLELGGTADAWENLGSPERLTRYQSRLALEAEGANSFPARLAKENDPWTIISASIGLARTGTAADRPVILAALDRVNWTKLDKQQRINWLRATGLVFARTGEPGEAERAKILAKIDTAFPAADTELDRELCRMLCYLQAPGIVGRTLGLMDTAGPTPPPDWVAVAKRNPTYGGDVERMMANQPPAQVIHYAYCLRVVKGPWSVDDRKRFFGWFDRLEEKSGGNSYVGFIKDLRKQALATATPEEREWLVKLAPAAVPGILANLPQPKGPGRNWTMEDVEKVAAEGLEGRNKENGRNMFRGSLCVACHRFGGEGGSAGPDLSALGGRFTVHDVAEAILDPSKVISDQYAFDLITRGDGSQVVGKLIEEKDETDIVATNPFDFSATIEIPKSDIKQLKKSPISPMPPGLIGRLNPDELKDLLAYLLGKQ